MAPPLRAALLLVALAAPGLSGCIDPIELDVGQPERRLVVQGLVREGPGPHEVLLRRSGAFTQGLDAIRGPETGARVTVLVGDGQEATFPEVTPGAYRAPAGVLVAVPGQTYMLHVELADGTVYTAGPEAMLEAPPLLAVRSGLVPGARLGADGDLLDDPRLEVRVDAGRVEGRSNFYRWTWRGVYSAESCYIPPPPLFPLEYCDRCFFPVEGSSLVELGNDSRVASEALLDQEAMSLRLFEQGHLLVPALFVTVEQQALTPEAHAYWSRVRAARDAVGSLFDPPAEDAVGNVVNQADPHDYALGYFTVVGTVTNDGCARRDAFPDFPRLPAIPTVGGKCGVTNSGSLAPPEGFFDVCDEEPFTPVHSGP